MDNEQKCICRICNDEVEDLRLGVCFECAEAEVIIDCGKDMYDEGDAKTAMEKLKFLISKGWKIKREKQ